MKRKVTKNIWICNACTPPCYILKNPKTLGDGCQFPTRNFVEATITYNEQIELERGQPVIVGPGNLRFFSHFGERKRIHTYNYLGTNKTINWSSWRLPTREELKAIGHDSGPWLASEDVCNE